MSVPKIKRSFSYGQGVFIDGNRSLTPEEYAKFKAMLLELLRLWKEPRELLAHHLGVSRFTLYRYETNVAKPSFTTFVKAKKFLAHLKSLKNKYEVPT